MVQFSIKVKGAQAMRRKLRELQRDLDNLDTVMKQASVFLDRWVQKNFRTEGGQVGGWDDLKAGGRWVGTGDNRRFDTSAKILQDTGRLRASFKPFYSKDNAGIGSELPYSEIHEYGLPTKNIPKRRMLPEAGDVSADIEKIIYTYIRDSLNKGVV